MRKKQNMNISKNAAFLILLFFFGMRTQAQQYPQGLEEIRSIGDTAIMTMTFVSEHELLALAYKLNDDHVSTLFLQKMRDDGELLSSMKILENEVQDNKFFTPITEIYLPENADPFFFLLCREPESDTCTFHKAVIHDDMSLTLLDYDWIGNHLPLGTYGHIMEKTAYSIVNKDDCVILTYNTDNDSIRMVRFDGEGNVLAERCFETHMEGYHSTLTTPDSLGFRVIRMRTDGHYGYSCFTFDTNLLIIDTILNVDQLSYPPVSCSDMAYFRVNPYSGKTYSINKWFVPAYNGNPEIYQDILMSVYDQNMVQSNYCWGIHTPTVNQAGFQFTISFGSTDDVYMAGGMDGIIPHNLYVAYLDQDLNKIGEVYYIHPSKYLIARSIVACPGGGCLVYCNGVDDNTHTTENCIYKISISDFLSIKDMHHHGLTMVTAYPNPAQDQLQLLFSPDVEPRQIELYDLQGRLVRSQGAGLESLSLQGLAPGQYVMKVTLTDGTVFSDKVVKE